MKKMMVIVYPKCCSGSIKKIFPATIENNKKVLCNKCRRLSRFKQCNPKEITNKLKIISTMKTKKELNKQYGRVVKYIDKMFCHLDKITKGQIKDMADYYSKSNNEIKGAIIGLKELTNKKQRTMKDT